LAGDRYQVVVHVEAEALREGSETGQSALDDGVGVSAETSRRLACDAQSPPGFVTRRGRSQP
jgi:hypothetical protein